MQIFTMGRAFSAVPGVATGRRVLNLPRGRPPLRGLRTRAFPANLYGGTKAKLQSQESTALQLQSTIVIVVSSCGAITMHHPAKEIHGDSWSASYGHVL